MLRAERSVAAGDTRRRGERGRGAGGVQLLDPAGDQLLADGRLVGLGEDVLDLGVGGRDDAVQDLGRVVVAELDALEVEDREAAEAGQLAGQAHVRDRVHRRRQDGHLEADPAEVLGEHDVGRVDRVGAGGEGHVLEAVRRADRIHLGAEDPPVGKRLGHGLVLTRNLPVLRRVGTVYPARRWAHTGGEPSTHAMTSSHEGTVMAKDKAKDQRAGRASRPRRPLEPGRSSRTRSTWRSWPGCSSSCRSSRSGSRPAASRSW